MKKKILSIILIVIIVMIVSITTTYATNYLYNSNEVYYDNTNSNITSSDVQGAIDELYTEATNYSTYNNRLTTLETLTGSNTLTTTAQTLTGAINELNSQKLKIKTVTCNNVAVTTKSGDGAYFTSTPCSTEISSSHTIIAISVLYWGGAEYSFVPYISSDDINSIGFTADGSMTIRNVVIRVVYI